MAKSKTIYICQNCGAEAAKWIGKCPVCNEWNTYVEEVIQKSPAKTGGSVEDYSHSKPLPISSITSNSTQRLVTQINELNRVLGGGIVPGSLILLGGEPGIGKSTLALQLALTIKDIPVLYISGEESAQQIKMRAERLGTLTDNCYIYSEIYLESILAQIESMQPGIVIIDSIQTLQTENIDSIPGSVSQIRECASRILKFAKTRSIPFILIGHITKDGNLAGPKILEHTVDTVLQFEGDTNYSYRIVRALKNRFGSTSELGMFEMHNNGLIEVQNPSEILLSHHLDNLSGVAIAASVDGIRPFLIEIQALVSTAAYGTPQRSSTGFDNRRLNMLLAVLEKRAGFKLATKDVFLNIAGGIKISEPGIDLAVISSILSSNVDRAINKNICFAAEVGLSGEIRPVNRIEQRVSEADKLGFRQILVSTANKKNLERNKYKTEIIYADKIEQAIKFLFH